MAAVTIPGSLMIKKLDKMNPWHNLGLTEWTNQFGLIRKFNESDGDGDYYLREKSNYKLWDFILYVNHSHQKAIIEYYSFPEDIEQFLSFCFNDVAQDGTWKHKDTQKQMDYFPYEKIYNEVWLKKIRKQN
jgi:hypothetical protein